MNTDQHKWRLSCEARQWIAWGYTTRAKVDELMNGTAEKIGIIKRRGQRAANELRAEMRRQWKLNQDEQRNQQTTLGF